MVKDRFKFRFWNTIRNKYEDTYCCSSRGMTLDYVVPEQCTGLRDKNGKLIYEGDIVRCSYGSEYYVGCVVWDYEEIQFSVEVSEELYSFSQHSDSHKIEIIGNIHENSDLIES